MDEGKLENGQTAAFQEENLTDGELVARYIKEHLEEAFTVDSLAKTFFMSRRSLQRHFKDEVGIPIREYVIRTRIERAEYLLSQTDLPVDEVAEQCGGLSRAHFFKVFRKYKGCSPERYRWVNAKRRIAARTPDQAEEA